MKKNIVIIIQAVIIVIIGVYSLLQKIEAARLFDEASVAYIIAEEQTMIANQQKELANIARTAAEYQEALAILNEEKAREALERCK